ncbi:tol-pal system protein YbgF [Limoniibacter endophyticus]|uniref:Cell division coordinator CpoB n=1 Tax=Limoniibacter endophyticus TaxID=1565040 RepID=A0A8J3DKK8_9HYPH|nr:tol-pal system protein YbgF [Limoniibacter endophyticus]GHC76713.1 tol-pal system protein YbgF [Limoniibacter endophyticus]
MFSRLILGSAIALSLAASVLPSNAQGLPGVFGSRSNDASRQAPAGQGGYILTQGSDPRVQQLEEQLRQLNGTIEELNFQILQMQEQIRKMQEDNEFRFQELEKNRADAGSGSTRHANAAPPAGGNSGGGSTDTIGTGSIDGVAPVPPMQQDQSQTAATQPSTAGNGTGEPPRTLGRLILDENGNVVSSNTDDNPTSSPLPPVSGGAQDQVAALPQNNSAGAGGSADAVYDSAYEHVLSGDYKTAETGFRSYIERFPKGEKSADAHFWLGESLIGQTRYRDAAEILLAASKNYRNSAKGPEILLKLGVSLAGMKQKEVACATFGEVDKRYPKASAALKARVTQEKTTAGC